MKPIGETYLGRNGKLAQSLPGYEAREPQIRMTDLCAATIEDGGVLLAEAGTGTGKSLSYSVPTILHAVRPLPENAERLAVVISTETIQLQEQLVRKDLPFLQQYLGVPFTFAIAKGIGNYFCRRNAEEFIHETRLLRPADVASAELLLGSVLDGEWSGDRTDLTERIGDGVWAEISGDDTCTKRACPFADECPYLAARAAYGEANVIVTNHTLFLLHHGLKLETDGMVQLLPPHDVWVADEAHTLADKAADTFGAEIRETRPANWVRKTRKRLKTLKVDFPHWTDRSWDDLAENVSAAAQSLYRWFHKMEETQGLVDGIRETARPDKDHLCDTLRPLCQALSSKVSILTAPEAGKEEKTTGKAVAAIARIGWKMIGDLHRMFDEPAEDDDGPEFVTYYERMDAGKFGTQAGKEVVTLYSKPVDTGWIFKDIRKGVLEVPNIEASIYTSATLCTGKNGNAWKQIANELGVKALDVETFRAESPFDWERQVKGYFPAHLPAPNEEGYISGVVTELLEIINHTQGRAFILFTSNKDMRETYERVKTLTSFPLLLQGEDGKDQLLQKFRTTPGAVLFGVKTFWTGVDIAGEALSCVVITKLPFPQPKHPLVDARCKSIERRGGNSFAEYMIPKAIQDMRQGFGRLIRSKRDTGLFAILDSRMHTKRYGGQFAAALPDFPYTVEEL